MSIKRQNLNFITSPSGLLVPSDADNPPIDAVDVTFELASSAKGDLLAGDGSGSFVRRSVGSNGQVLTADSGSPGGVKWDAPAAGSGRTLLNTVTCSGSQTTVSFSGISGAYVDLFVEAVFATSADQVMFVQLNGDTGSNYDRQGFGVNNTSSLFGAAVAATSGECAWTGSATNRGGYAMLTFPMYATSFSGYAPYRTLESRWWASRGTATSNQQGGINMVTWRNTAAITSILFILGGGNFTDGSVFKLWGVS